MNRRILTAVCVFLLLLAFALGGFRLANAGESSNSEFLVYIGTYTDHGSKGIYSAFFDPVTGKINGLSLAVESAQPSFLAVAASGKFLYAANEILSYNGQPAGAASAFKIDPRIGQLLLLNQVSSLDKGPAYITLDRTGKYILVANYTLGSVAVFPILENGQLGNSTAFVRHKGSSVNPERQQGPHAHAVALSPDDRFAIVADLGLDQLLVYPFDPAKGTLGSKPRIVKTAPGAGPRHLAFHPNGKFLYVINELHSTIVVYSYKAASGALSEMQTISTLPTAFTGTNTAAEIEVHSSGKFLYASNRGDDSIAVFTIDPVKGTLTKVESVSSRGKTPRHFSIDPTGAWLIAANQDSDNLIVFRIDKVTGDLAATGEVIRVPSPACVKLVSPLGNQVRASLARTAHR